MNQNRNTNFALLNQQEIDTLVKFLTVQKNAVDGDVMSQASIDKLIRLIQTDKEKLILNPFLSLTSAGITAVDKLKFREDSSELCELRCNINSETNLIELTIYNTVTDKSYDLTPSIFDETDSSGWGFAISPSHFSQIAYSLAVKFTQDTYDFICAVFAKVNYGSETHKISDFYLPGNNTLVDSLI